MDRNFIIAILVSTLIIIVYSSPQYQKRFGRDVPVVESFEKQEQATPETQENVSVGQSRQKSTPPASTEREKEREETVAPAEMTETRTAVPPDGFIQVNRPPDEKTVTIQNDDMILELSSRGGVMTAVVLKNFQGPEEGEPVQLIEEGQTWYDGAVNTPDESLDFRDVIFEADLESDADVTFTALFEDGRAIHRMYSLDTSGYVLRANTKLEGPWGDAEVIFAWNGPINRTEIPFRMIRIWPFSLLMRDDTLAYDKIVFLGDGVRRTTVNGREKTDEEGERIYLNEDHGQKVEAKKPGKGTDTFVGDLSWMAVRNKYFMAAAVPVENKRWHAESSFTFDGETKWFDFSMAKDLTDGDLSMEMYLGPISYERLKNYGHDLTEAMELSFRFIRPLSILFLWLIKKIHAIISNWGLVIIAFSIVIKLAVYPLSKSSYDSMRKMSELQPQITELREKYKNNPQMLQKATMELYKKEGVNPFGGCLPMVLQMPVFFALYPVVGRAFELRQAMFIPNWIEDLSRPDPFYILPVAMGISMFFQSKSTMKDPNQKPMLYIMPVMMVMIFANFSAGLTLYWFMFNVMSFLQQKIHR